MTQSKTASVPVAKEVAPTVAKTAAAWPPFEALRQQVNRLFDDAHGGSLSTPFRDKFFAATPSWNALPAVDVAETEKAFEITADMPGLDEKNVEVKLVNGCVQIVGEKREEKEEKRKDYHLQERQFGSFQRTFRIPHGVDSDKIVAEFQKGVLKVTLPKVAGRPTAEKKIAIKAA